MGVFRKLLAELREGGAATEKTAIERAIEIQKAVARGADPAVQALVSLALAHPEEADLYIIHLPRMPLNSVMALVRSRPSEVKSLLASMLALLSGADWRGRSFDLANGPLHWFETVARCAAQVGNDGLLEDAASCLFDAEARWQRFAQRRLTRAWLEAIDAGDAQTVARALRRHPSAAKWYSDEGWRPQSAHSLIRRALAEGIGASKADKS
jgi:hypothetical protein